MGWGMEQCHVAACLPQANRVEQSSPSKCHREWGNSSTPSPLHWPFGWEKQVVSGPFWPWAVYQAHLRFHFNFLLQGTVAPPQSRCSPALFHWVSVLYFHRSLPLFLRCGQILTHKAGFQWVLNCYIRGWIIVTSSPHGHHSSASGQIAVIHCRQPVIASKAAAGALLTSALKMGF